MLISAQLTAFSQASDKYCIDTLKARKVASIIVRERFLTEENSRLNRIVWIGDSISSEKDSLIVGLEGMVGNLRGVVSHKDSVIATSKKKSDEMIKIQKRKGRRNLSVIFIGILVGLLI